MPQMQLLRRRRNKKEEEQKKEKDNDRMKQEPIVRERVEDSVGCWKEYLAGR